MSTIDEKKWFVYLGDHHEGPFALSEIQQKMQSRQVTNANHVWCDGMPDWLPMSDVKEFAHIGSPSVLTPEVSPNPLPEDDKTSDISLSEAPSDEALVEPVSELQSNHQNASMQSQLAEDTLIQTEEPLEELPSASESEAYGGSIAGETATPLSSLSGAEKNALAEEPIQLSPQANFQTAGQASQQAPSQARKYSSNFPSDDFGVRGGESTLKKILKPIVAIMVIAGVGGSIFISYQRGYLAKYLDNRMGKQVVSVGKTGLESIAKWGAHSARVIGEKAPWANKYLGKLFSAIPAIKDVSKGDMELLNSAAGTSMNNGLRVAVALSQDDIKNPKFHVATNLDTPVRFEIFVVGIADTLLNHTNYKGYGTLVTKNKLGSTMKISYESAKGAKGPLPRGDYNIFVLESQNQLPEVSKKMQSAPAASEVPKFLPQGRKLLASNRYFLGGEKDQQYKMRLKAFHDKLKEKADQELSELKQFKATLFNQYNSTIKTFSNLKKGKKTWKIKSEWNKFHRNWTKFNRELVKSFGKWTPDMIRNELYYGSLYEITKNAGSALESVHSSQNEYFTRNVNNDEFAKSHREKALIARKLLLTLKTKVSTLEKTPTTPNGMPTLLVD